MPIDAYLDVYDIPFPIVVIVLKVVFLGIKLRLISRGIPNSKVLPFTEEASVASIEMPVQLNTFKGIAKKKQKKAILWFKGNFSLVGHLFGK